MSYVYHFRKLRVYIDVFIEEYSLNWTRGEKRENESKFVIFLIKPTFKKSFHILIATHDNCSSVFHTLTMAFRCVSLIQSHHHNFIFHLTSLFYSPEKFIGQQYWLGSCYRATLPLARGQTIIVWGGGVRKRAGAVPNGQASLMRTTIDKETPWAKWPNIKWMNEPSGTGFPFT